MSMERWLSEMWLNFLSSFLLQFQVALKVGEFDLHDAKKLLN